MQKRSYTTIIGSIAINGTPNGLTPHFCLAGSETEALEEPK